MATIRSYTTIEQSRKLAEILPLESADMVYVHTTDLEGDEHYDIDFRNNQPLFEEDVCAWSLAALLGVLPYCPDLSKHTDGKWYITTYPNDVHTCLIAYDNPVDACYEMIIHLNELNLL